MKYYLLTACLSAMLFSSACNDHDAGFYFEQNDQGFALSEKGKPVFHYQQFPRSLTGEYVCNNYLHPLYNLEGDTLTEEFPGDHPYHRGVFWAWHQLYCGSENLGDGWINSGISYEVAGVTTETASDYAVMKTEVYWKSDSLPSQSAFLKENTTVTVHPSDEDVRLIDISIELKALFDSLMIGGSDDPKGYGGLCLRLNIPDDMKFISEGNTITPQELQINAGRWMDFSGSFGDKGSINGIAILCSPQNPVFPSPWILRQSRSMQNAVWPGRDRVMIGKEKPLIIRYRLVIHKGDASAIDLKMLQEEYSSE